MEVVRSEPDLSGIERKREIERERTEKEAERDIFTFVIGQVAAGETLLGLSPSAGEYQHCWLYTVLYHTLHKQNTDYTHPFLSS